MNKERNIKKKTPVTYTGARLLRPAAAILLVSAILCTALNPLTACSNKNKSVNAPKAVYNNAVLRIKQRMYPGMIKDMRACIDAFYLMLDAKDAIHVKKMVNFSNWQEVFYSLVVASTGMTREEAEEYCCRGVKKVKN